MELIPKVSLLIAMRNESEYIERCINSILHLDYPPEKYEVFIMDGGSTDTSRDIVNRMIAGYGNFLLVDNPGIIQSRAWNIGLKKATGEIIGIMSAHSEIAPDYVNNLVETIQRTGADMVGGPTVAFSEGWIAESIALALNSPFGVGDANFHYTTKEMETDTVFMGACNREVYSQIGGFDEELIRNQDDEFSYRLRSHGGRIICNPGIRSLYFNRTSLVGLCNQYYMYGYWKVRVLQKHTRQMKLRQFVPSVWIISMIISMILLILSIAHASSVLLLAAGFVPCLYTLVTLGASIMIAMRKSCKYFPVLPVTFFILHAAYGSGFIVGLFKFWNRWHDKKGSVPYIKFI